jgi:hypothetical protein
MFFIVSWSLGKPLGSIMNGEQQYVRPSHSLSIPETPEDYKALLVEVLTCMDNDARPVYENTVVKSLQSPNTAFLLVQIINEPNIDPVASAGYRQLAAVLLRKRVLSMWRGLEPENQDQLKQILLDQIGTEPIRLVRFAIAHVLCVIARVELRRGWPQLLEAVHAASQSESAEHRELACVLVHALAQHITDATGEGGTGAMNRNLQLAGEVLLQCLNDSVWPVRRAALKAVAELTPRLGGKGHAKAALVNELVPRAMAMVQECGGATSARSQRPSETTRVAMEAIDVLEQIVDLHSSKFVHLDGIVQLMMQTATARAAHMRIREEATEVLWALVGSRPKYFIRRGLVDAVLEIGYALVCEDDGVAFEEPGPDEDEEDDEGNDGGGGFEEGGYEDPLADAPRPPCVFGGRLINAVGEALPTKRVLPVVLGHLSQLANSGTDMDPRQRKGYIIAVACVSAGCAESLRRHVPQLLMATQHLLQDPVPFVRAAAVHSLVQFAANLQPEILMHHAQLMPLLLAQLDDPDESVRTRVARTLESVCDELGPELEDYIGLLLSKLTGIIASSSQVAQRHICGVLAACGHSQSAAMKEHGAAVFELLYPATTPGNPTMLRAKAIEAVGVIAAGVGRDVFTEATFTTFWPCVVDGFTSKFAELREMCFMFAANMAALLHADFAGFAEPVFEAAVTLLLDHDAKLKSTNPLAAADFRLPNEAAAGNSDDSDDGEPEEMLMYVRHADIEEKTAAIYCLGAFAVELGHAYAHHLPDQIRLLEDYIMHMHKPLRVNALCAVADTIRGRFITSYPPGAAPAVVKGQGAPADDVFDEELRDTMDEFIRAEVIPIMTTDDSKEVVAAACDAVVHIVRHVGAVAIHPYLEEILDATNMLLCRDAPCQNVEDDNERDSEDENGGEALGAGGDDLGDHDRVLIDSVSEIVDTICVAYGPSFLPYFQQLSGSLLPYTASDRPGEDHVFAVGVIATCLEALGSSCTSQFLAPAYEMALRLINDSPEPTARSNCCFLLRVLVEQHGSQFSQQQAQVVLQALWGILSSEDELPSTMDNAVSAACSMVRCVSHLLPVTDVLKEILPQIPMRIDTAENGNACRTLAHLADPACVRSMMAGDGSTFGLYTAAVRRVVAARSGVIEDADRNNLWQAFTASANAVGFPLE